MPKENEVVKENVEAKIKSSIDAITTDEHAGKSGSYIFNPATGKRSPKPESLTTQENKE